MLLNNNHQADAHLYSSMKFRLEMVLLFLQLLHFSPSSFCSLMRSYVCDSGVPVISFNAPFAFYSTLARVNINFWMKIFAED